MGVTQSDLEMVMKQAFVHSDAGRYAEAAQMLAQVLRVSPNHPEALHELGMMHHRCGRTGLAIEAIGRAADVAPGNVRYRFNLALMLLRSTPPRAADSVPHFLKAADLASERRDAAMLNTIGSALQQAGRLTAAAVTFRRALAFRTDQPAVWNRLALALQEAGKLDEALAATAEALRIDATFADAISNALLTLNYHDRFTAAEVAAEHVRLAGELLPAKTQAPPDEVRPERKAAAIRRPQDRIRVGYLSPDLCQHSVAFFIYPILQNHDREKFFITCYSDVATPDLVTQDLQKKTERWRPIHKMSDDQVAQQITADGIDILVDLAGHTKANRMPLLARRVAPIQATYLGYPNTSGLTTIDYRITDALADPVGQTESLHSEKLIRLPDAFFTYLTPSGYPDVVPPPAAESGRITFAVMTNFAKVRPASMELWARVIESVPGSRLLIQAKALDDPQTRQSVEQFFAGRNIAADRLELRGWAHFPEFLQQLAEVDIALDTFPFVGHTASCNMLWMGIPIVTRAGQVHRSRMGVSILTNLGLSELIAQSDDDYVRIAGSLASDIPRVKDLRMGMRKRMSESVLMDGPRFVRNLEAAYEQMIREFFPER